MNKMHFNSATLTGRLVDELVFSHDSERAQYYKGTLAVERLSGTVDFLPVLVNSRAIDGLPALADKLIAVTGQISTFNKVVDGKSRLVVELFAHHIDILDSGEHYNNVTLRGALCKAPTFRVTPNGREICELLLAVNRPNGKSAYVPCIAWGKDARNARMLSIGATLDVYGRFQSREYMKKLDDGTAVKRVAYEVSAARIVVEAD